MADVSEAEAEAAVSSQRRTKSRETSLFESWRLEPYIVYSVLNRRQSRTPDADEYLDESVRIKNDRTNDVPRFNLF